MEDIEPPAILTEYMQFINRDDLEDYVKCLAVTRGCPVGPPHGSHRGIGSH